MSSMKSNDTVHLINYNFDSPTCKFLKITLNTMIFYILNESFI